MAIYVRHEPISHGFSHGSSSTCPRAPVNCRPGPLLAYISSDSTKSCSKVSENRQSSALLFLLISEKRGQSALRACSRASSNKAKCHHCTDVALPQLLTPPHSAIQFIISQCTPLHPTSAGGVIIPTPNVFPNGISSASTTAAIRLCATSLSGSAKSSKATNFHP